MTEPPSNPGLVHAIAAMLEAPDDASDLMMRPLLDALVESTLVSAHDPLTLKRRGGSHLALFSDVVELQLFEPGEPWVPLRADEAIKQVARGDYAGLIINPGPRQLELSAEDIADFFDIDD